MSAVDDQIAALQQQVSALTSGNGTAATKTPDYAAYVQNNPDLASLYASQGGMAKGKTAAQFGEFHWTNYAQPLGEQRAYTPYGPADQAAAKPTDGPGDTAKGITGDATDAATKGTDAATAATDALTKTITDLGTSLSGVVSSSTDAFQQSQTNLLKGFQDAQADSAKRMAGLAESMRKAMNDQTDALKATGQKSKKPNYAAALDRNRLLNGGGLSSTSLTGPMGVPTTSLTLGATSLLGAP